MKESKIEYRSKSLADQFGWSSFKGDSVNGGADQIFLRGGIGFCVEFKTATGTQEGSQKWEQARCEQRNIPYFVCHSVKEFVEVLKEMNKWTTQQ